MKVKTILISQPQPADIDKSPYADLINKFGLKLEFKKFFSIVGLTSSEFRQQRIDLADYTGIIFTSRNVIDHYFRLAKEVRFIVPDTMKYFCTSDQIAYYLQKYIQFRKRKIFYGDQSLQSLITLIKKHKEDKILLPTNDSPNEELCKALKSNEIKFREAAFYRNEAADLSTLDIKSFNMLAIFSPHGIRSLKHNFPDYEQGEQLIAAYGNTTLQAAEEAGLNVQVKAPTQTSPSMTMAISEFLTQIKKKK